MVNKSKNRRVTKPLAHRDITKKLSNKLKPVDIYDWLMTIGYYPENYVLPPCFSVEKYPRFGKTYTTLTKTGKYNPNASKLLQIQFPKSVYTDRTFGVINPEIHCDVAFQIATNWKKLNRVIFSSKNNVCTYSFPIPLDKNNPGKIGKTRSGRMIYEFIEMAENDLASEAFRYKYIIIIDIKNFYPSIYTHSIAWAIHNRNYIHVNKRRHDYNNYVGNRLDKLFQRSNDDQTNGLSIGPAVCDYISETILSRIDSELSKKLDGKVFLPVRFKDDYRILCDSEECARTIIKSLQRIIKVYNLELNENKTNIVKLPDGLFRPWVSRYHAINPEPKQYYSFKKFKEVYYAVIAIDRDHPNTGVIDRFLADIVTDKNQPNFEVNKKSLPKIISLLILLAELRIKSFPKVLGIIEAILRSEKHPWYKKEIGTYLGDYLDGHASFEPEYRYLIIWILYFMKSNGLDRFIKRKYPFKDPFVRSVQSGRNNIFTNCKDFKLFRGIRESSRKKSLLEHLDVFSPQ